MTIMHPTISMVSILIMLFATSTLFLSAVAFPIEVHIGTDLEKRTTYSNARFTYFYESGYGACGGKNSLVG